MAKRPLKIAGRVIPGGWVGTNGTVLVPIENWYNATNDIDCCEGAWQGKGVSSYDLSLINLANPGTNDLTEGVAPGWDAQHGWMFRTELGSYLKTGIVPEWDYSYVIRFSNLDVNAVNSVMGAYSLTGVSDWDLYPEIASISMVRFYGNDVGHFPPIVSAGIFGMSGTQPYRDGAYDGDTAPGMGWTEVAQDVYLGAVNILDTAFWICTVDVQAFAIYSCELTPYQITGVMEAMKRL